MASMLAAGGAAPSSHRPLHYSAGAALGTALHAVMPLDADARIAEDVLALAAGS